MAHYKWTKYNNYDLKIPLNCLLLIGCYIRPTELLHSFLRPASSNCLCVPSRHSVSVWSIGPEYPTGQMVTWAISYPLSVNGTFPVSTGSNLPCTATATAALCLCLIPHKSTPFTSRESCHGTSSPQTRSNQAFFIQHISEMKCNTMCFLGKNK